MKLVLTNTKAEGIWSGKKMNTSEILKNNVQNNLDLFKEIADFCINKNLSKGHPLELVIDNFVSTTGYSNLILQHYNSLVIEDVSTGEDIGGLEKEICRHIIWQNRMMFISTFSSIEFKMKEIIRSKSGTDLYNFYQKKINDPNNKKGDVSIYSVLKESNRLNYFTPDEFREIIFLNEVRNTAIHNKCIPSKNIKEKIYGEEFSFTTNVEMRGKLVGFTLFTKRLVEIFYNWSQRV